MEEETKTLKESLNDLREAFFNFPRNRWIYKRLIRAYPDKKDVAYITTAAILHIGAFLLYIIIRLFAEWINPGG